MSARILMSRQAAGTTGDYNRVFGVDATLPAVRWVGLELVRRTLGDAGTDRQSARLPQHAPVADEPHATFAPA